jgi:hypothetical protein
MKLLNKVILPKTAAGHLLTSLIKDWQTYFWFIFIGNLCFKEAVPPSVKSVVGPVLVCFSAVLTVYNLFALQKVLSELRAISPKTDVISPEKLGLLASFLLPRKIRQTSFEPYFEELKEDRLEARLKIHSCAGRMWVEFCFYLRLFVALLQSFGCWFKDIASKASPLLKWILGS